MSLSASEVQELYGEKIDRYAAFIEFFRSSQAMRALLHESGLLRDGLRALDAGCGFGMVTFALVEALRESKLRHAAVDAFDLTPEMLERFQRELNSRGITGVQLRQADVLKLDVLPQSWTNYDLIISASMLEYLPKQDLPSALSALRARLSHKGTIVVMITRRTPETKVFIELAWRAERYSRTELIRAFREAGFRNVTFLKFTLRYFWLNRANFVVRAAA